MPKSVFIVASMMLTLGACSTEQAYTAAQSWQRNQCERLPQQADAQRCVERSGPSFDAYSRETRMQR